MRMMVGDIRKTHPPAPSLQGGGDRGSDTRRPTSPVRPRQQLNSLLPLPAGRGPGGGSLRELLLAALLSFVLLFPALLLGRRFLLSAARTLVVERLRQRRQRLADDLPHHVHVGR